MYRLFDGCIGFWADVLAFRAGCVLYQCEITSESTPRTNSDDANNPRALGGRLQARRPSNQDATRNSNTPSEMYRVLVRCIGFWAGILGYQQRDDTQPLRMARKSKHKHSQSVAWRRQQLQSTRGTGTVTQARKPGRNGDFWRTS